MATESKQARDYFRVRCPVLLACRNCDTDKVPRVSAESHFPNSEHMNLLRELNRIEHEHAHLLHALADLDRNLSVYLGAINRKIDAVARHMVSLHQSDSGDVEQEVSLSEGGLSFRSSEALVKGTIVALHLTLLPSYIGLASYAKIIACEPDGGGFRVSASFQSLPENDRQILARHVMQVQLQAKRAQSERI